MCNNQIKQWYYSALLMLWKWTTVWSALKTKTCCVKNEDEIIIKEGEKLYINFYSEIGTNVS